VFTVAIPGLTMLLCQLLAAAMLATQPPELVTLTIFSRAMIAICATAAVLNWRLRVSSDARLCRRMDWNARGPQDVLPPERSPVLAAAADLVTMLLVLGFLNHRSVERPTRVLWQQLILIEGSDAWRAVANTRLDVVEADAAPRCVRLGLPNAPRRVLYGETTAM
jgi:hypothetical protein